MVTADTAGPVADAAGADTADLAYVRLHGEEELYVSGYDDARLDLWAGRVAQWRDQGRDVVVYFDNDVKVRAPVDAQRLAQRLTQPLTQPRGASPRRPGRTA